MNIRVFMLSQGDVFKVIRMDPELPLRGDQLGYLDPLVGELTEIILIEPAREIDVYSAPVVETCLEGRLLRGGQAQEAVSLLGLVDLNRLLFL